MENTGALSQTAGGCFCFLPQRRGCVEERSGAGGGGGGWGGLMNKYKLEQRDDSCLEKLSQSIHYIPIQPR